MRTAVNLESGRIGGPGVLVGAAKNAPKLAGRIYMPPLHSIYRPSRLFAH